jgi:hypothetical protein
MPTMISIDYYQKIITENHLSNSFYVKIITDGRPLVIIFTQECPWVFNNREHIIFAKNDLNI